MARFTTFLTSGKFSEEISNKRVASLGKQLLGAGDCFTSLPGAFLAIRVRIGMPPLLLGRGVGLGCGSDLCIHLPALAVFRFASGQGITMRFGLGPGSCFGRLTPWNTNGMPPTALNRLRNSFARVSLSMLRTYAYPSQEKDLIQIRTPPSAGVARAGAACCRALDRFLLCGSGRCRHSSTVAP